MASSMSTPITPARRTDAEDLRRLPLALVLVRVGLALALGLALWLLLR